MLALALALAGCGGESSTASAPSTAATITAAAGDSLSSAKPAAATAACASHLADLVAQLEHLRRSLVIGVSYEQYVAELGTIRRTYQRLPVGKLDLACVSGAATDAERSFDGYLAAANTWGDCVSEAGCETAALEPKLQRKWRAAAAQLAAAERALAAG